MSSKMTECFSESRIQSNRRNFPLPGNNAIRPDAIAIGVTFKKDPGYLRISTSANSEEVLIKPFSTKSTLRREPVTMKFEIDQSVNDFLSEGFDTNKIHVEHELEGDELNKAVHLLRVFSGWINSSGSRHARNSILS